MCTGLGAGSRSAAGSDGESALEEFVGDGEVISWFAIEGDPIRSEGGANVVDKKGAESGDCCIARDWESKDWDKDAFKIVESCEAAENE